MKVEHYLLMRVNVGVVTHPPHTHPQRQTKVLDDMTKDEYNAHRLLIFKKTICANFKHIDMAGIHCVLIFDSLSTKKMIREYTSALRNSNKGLIIHQLLTDSEFVELQIPERETYGITKCIMDTMKPDTEIIASTQYDTDMVVTFNFFKRVHEVAANITTRTCVSALDDDRLIYSSEHGTLAGVETGYDSYQIMPTVVEFVNRERTGCGLWTAQCVAHNIYSKVIPVIQLRNVGVGYVLHSGGSISKLLAEKGHGTAVNCCPNMIAKYGLAMAMIPPATPQVTIEGSKLDADKQWIVRIDISSALDVSAFTEIIVASLKNQTFRDFAVVIVGEYAKDEKTISQLRAIDWGDIPISLGVRHKLAYVAIGMITLTQYDGLGLNVMGILNTVLNKNITTNIRITKTLNLVVDKDAGEVCGSIISDSDSFIDIMIVLGKHAPVNSVRLGIADAYAIRTVYLKDKPTKLVSTLTPTNTYRPASVHRIRTYLDDNEINYPIHSGFEIKQLQIV